MMKITYPKSITIQMDEPTGFYFDIELKETPGGMVFEGWLYHTDYSIKSHIVSTPAKTVENDESIDWLPIVCMMNEYIINQCLISGYWELITLIEN